MCLAVQRIGILSQAQQLLYRTIKPAKTMLLLWPTWINFIAHRHDCWCFRARSVTRTEAWLAAVTMRGPTMFYCCIQAVLCVTSLLSSLLCKAQSPAHDGARRSVAFGEREFNVAKGMCSLFIKKKQLSSAEAINSSCILTPDSFWLGFIALVLNLLRWSVTFTSGKQECLLI